jgi:hypothetical protein
MVFSALLLMGAAPAQLPGPGCNAPSHVTFQTVARVTGRNPRAADTLLWGIAPQSEDGPAQVYAYARRRTDWAAYRLGDTQQIITAYRTASGNRLILAFHTSGDPGETFEGLLFGSAGQLIACPTIRFPQELNRNESTNKRDWVQEYLSFETVKIDRLGRGELIANADVEFGGRPRHMVFRYTTRDGGRSWSEPQIL